MSISSSIVTMLAANSTIAANFETVGHAWFMEPLDNLPTEIPALFVIPGDDVSARSMFDSFVGQEVGREIGVFTVSHRDEIDERVNDLRAALLGYQWNSYYDLMQHLKGATVKINGEIIWRLDVFTTTTQIRQT